MKKKGMMASTLGRLILILVIALILIVFIGKVTLFGKERSDVEICRLSVLAASKSKIVGKPLVESIQCETRDIEINEKGIYKNNKKIETFRNLGVSEGKSDAENKIKNLIANELYNCWYQFGEGKFNVFDDWNGQTIKCFLCSDINFKEIYSTFPSIDLTEFMAETKIPNTDKTYFQYIGVDPENIGQVRYIIDTSKSYSVIFSISKWSSFGQAWALEGGGAVVGAVAGAKIGAALGTIVPGAGTAVGAGVGGIIGAGAGTILHFMHTDEWATTLLLEESKNLPNFCHELY